MEAETDGVMENAATSIDGPTSKATDVGVVNGSAANNETSPAQSMEPNGMEVSANSDGEGSWDQQNAGGNANGPMKPAAAGGQPAVRQRPGWQQAPPPNVSANGGQLELWVETKTDDGKSYYYHAMTRETTWIKPEGANVKIMSQAEIEEVNKRQQPAVVVDGVKVGDGSQEGHGKPGGLMHAMKPGEAMTSQPPPHLMNQPPPTQQQAAAMSHPPPNVAGPGMGQPAGVMHQQPPFFQPAPGMHPPNFGQPPFGMPPPGYGGGFPPGANPWGMAGPWNQQHMHGLPGQQQQEKPAKNLIIKPGVIDPAVISRAAEWSEHRAPDGRPYYYHAARGESVWEKPQALRDMEAARMAAHSGATPQQAASVVPTGPPMGLPQLMNPLMHMPPGGGMPGFDPNVMAFNAAAKANESSKAAQAAALEKEAKKAAEEKRKKEEEQKKSTAPPAAAAKPVDKSRPISSTPIAGTPWCVVWTGDARVFFYNPSTRTSVWERPEDLLDREDVDKAVANVPDQLKSMVGGSEAEKGDPDGASPDKGKQAGAIHVSEPEDEDDEVIKIRTESESSVEEVPTKKSRLADKLAKKSDANAAVVEAEVLAAKERAVVPLETRVRQFKEMLREKDVSAFSTWEKELHKIVFDPRYLMLTSKERKQVFEKYVKDRAEEERKEKRNKMRQKREDFRKLMEDAKLHGKSSFSEFCQRYGKDERYRAIEKIRERESLFNEYIVDVRRREKEEKMQRKEQIRKDFLDMLRERNDFDRHTRWHDVKKRFESDSRYRAVENSMYREEYFQDYMRIMKDEKRKQREEKEKERERERERDRERNRERDRKSDRKKERDRSRSRDRGRDKSKEREKGDKDREKDKDKERDRDGKRDKDKDKEAAREGDKDAKAKDKDAKNDDKKTTDETEDGEHSVDENEPSDHEADDEAERLRKERERQLRAEQSIREREKEVQRTLAGHLRDRDKEREHHKRDEAIGHFNALLTDLVRNPDLSWKEAKRQLRKDHRWEMIDSLDRDDREKIFNEHIDALMKKKREKFREMLDEIATLELTSSWKDIKKLIKEDPRYLKYNNSEKCEREFRDYIKDKTLNAKVALRELLQECKLITHKTIDMINENPHHLKEIQDILKNDKRYLVLEHMSDERATIVVNYLEELNKRGPPPPPTASESTRRNK